jgi:site-specific recombinase XerD
MAMMPGSMKRGGMSMPRKLPPFVERWRDRHGKMRVYFRKDRGPRLPLPDTIGSDEFNAAYQAALVGRIAPVRERHARAAAGTINALVISYKQSAAYKGLRETTKAGYASRIETLRTMHGHRTVAGLSRERIITGILQPYADRPGAALSILKMLRILIRHAINLGWLKHDPALGIKRPKIKRIRSWTDGEIETYRARWPLGTRQRTAFELFLNTGQRRSDVVRMAWSHITAESKIVVVQQKTGRRLLIPLHRDLLATLAAADRGHVSILTTMYGKSFTVDGFSQWMRDAITRAGLSIDCQPHGLRKATGRRLAEAGATSKMIMSILGHTTLSEAERYTEEADQAALAEDAVIKLEGHMANRIAQTTPSGLGKAPKTEGKSE